MSVRLNQELSSWKDVLAQLGRIGTTWKGYSLSSRDHTTYIEAILMCGMVLSDLSNRYPGCGSHRDHVLWCYDATNTDVSDLAAFLPDVIYRLRHYCGDTDKCTYADFKHQLASSYPRAGKLLAPVKEAVSRFLCDPSSDTLFAPYQFFSFLTHLTLEDIDMSVELEMKFVENEERVAQHHAPKFMISWMREIMR